MDFGKTARLFVYAGMLLALFAGCVGLPQSDGQVLSSERSQRLVGEPSPTPYPTPEGPPKPSPTPMPTLEDGVPPMPSPTPRPTLPPLEIVGGVDADPGNWPWQARLTVLAFDEDSMAEVPFLCGGSLIGPAWVVTAAHCVHDDLGLVSSSAITVTLGDHNQFVQEPSEQIVSVASIISHPDFDPITLDHDIALLELETPAQENNEVQRIPLVTSPEDDDLVEEDTLATITGWGTTSFGGFLPAFLQEAEVPIVSNFDCNQVYSGQITDDMLCAGFLVGGIDTCQGDSGGPLVVADTATDSGWRLAGITSWGEQCALPGFFGVYTRVSRYVPWLTAHTDAESVVQIVAAHSGKCLEVAGGTFAIANGNLVEQWECLGMDQTNQLWHLIPVGESFRIVAAHSGKCLEIAGGPLSMADFALAGQWNCLGTEETNQLWNLVETADGTQVVAAHSGKCLEVAGGTSAIANGNLVQQAECVGVDQTNQLWNLVEQPGGP